MRKLILFFLLITVTETIIGCSTPPKAPAQTASSAQSSLERPPDTAQEHWEKRGAEEQAEKWFDTHNGPRK